MAQINVPRVKEITGKKTVEQERDEREWKRARKPFAEDTKKYGFGTPESKAAWLRRIQRTRSC